MFCETCRDELSVKRSTLVNHIKSLKHVAAVKQLKEIKKREHDLAEMMRLRDKEVNLVVENLSMECRIFRIKVLTTFLKAEVALNKLDIFRPLLEESV